MPCAGDYVVRPILRLLEPADQDRKVGDRLAKDMGQFLQGEPELPGHGFNSPIHEVSEVIRVFHLAHIYRHD